MYCSMRKIKIVLHASAFLHLSLSASENGNLNAPPQIAETWEQAVVMPETNMDKEAGKEAGGTLTLLKMVQLLEKTLTPQKSNGTNP